MKMIFFLLLSYSAFADVTLNDAYRREKTFLLSQKEALLKMKSSLSMSFKDRKIKAQREIDFNQNELSALMLRNQELHEEFKGLEKMTKESSQMSGQLEKNSIKITDMLGAIKAKAGLTNNVHSETDPVKHLELILNDALKLVDSISSSEWKSQAFLDEKEHLVQGEILFQGLFSAWGKLDGKFYSLVPYNNEFLKVAVPFNGTETYLFTPNFERSGFKAAKSWKESVADAIPGLVMMMIMICVLGLFILLARA